MVTAHFKAREFDQVKEQQGSELLRDAYLPGDYSITAATWRQTTLTMWRCAPGQTAVRLLRSALCHP